MTPNRAAFALSAIFSPPLVVCYGVAAIFPHVEDRMLWALLLVAVFVLPPVAYVLYMVAAGAASNFHLSKQAERFRPLKFMVINTAVGMLVFSRLGSPALVLDIILACLIALLAVYAATLNYKVSAHSASISSLSVIMYVLYGAPGAAAAALIPLVSWARVRLNAHTVYQTVAGVTIGGGVTFAVLAFKGQL